MSSPEFEFAPERNTNNVTMVEGLSYRRAITLCERATRQRVAVPRLTRMSKDRDLKEILFPDRSVPRDSVAESMALLANRRSVLTEVLTNRRDNETPMLLRMHLLSSYSSLRDDNLSVHDWLKMVELTFGGILPNKIIMLDHRTVRGNMDMGQADNATRDRGYVERDCRRRYDALRVLREHFGTVVLNIPAGTASPDEYRRSINFINKEF